MEYGNHNEEVMSTALKNIKSIADVNTVIGKPFTGQDGTVIFPISKITIGLLTGGGEYGTNNRSKRQDEYPFSGGSGAAVSMNPVGFLVKSGDEIQVMSLGADSRFDKLFDAAGSVIKKFTKEQ